MHQAARNTGAVPSNGVPAVKNAPTPDPAPDSLAVSINRKRLVQLHRDDPAAVRRELLAGLGADIEHRRIAGHVDILRRERGAEMRREVIREQLEAVTDSEEKEANLVVERHVDAAFDIALQEVQQAVADAIGIEDVLEFREPHLAVVDVAINGSKWFEFFEFIRHRVYTNVARVPNFIHFRKMLIHAWV